MYKLQVLSVDSYQTQQAFSLEVFSIFVRYTNSYPNVPNVATVHKSSNKCVNNPSNIQ